MGHRPCSRAVIGTGGSADIFDGIELVQYLIRILSNRFYQRHVVKIASIDTIEADSQLVDHLSEKGRDICILFTNTFSSFLYFITLQAFNSSCVVVFIAVIFCQESAKDVFFVHMQEYPIALRLSSPLYPG